MRCHASLALLVSLAAGCAAGPRVTPLRYGPPLVQAPVDASFRRTPPPLPPVVDAVDAPWQTTLPNGLSIVYVPRHDLPLVTSVLVVGRGALDLGDAGASVQEMVYLFRNGGTSPDESPSVQAAAREGASFGADSTEDVLWAESRAPREGFAAALRRLAIGGAMGHLSPAEYERREGEWRRRVTARGGSTGKGSARVLFGASHAYGSPSPSETALTTEEAQALHDRLFRPAQSTLVVVGDVSKEEVVNAATRELGAWAPGETLPRVTARPPALNGPRVTLINRWNLAQPQALVFARGPDPDSEDVAPLSLAVTIAGGAVSSKLWDQLREQGDGYTSGASLQEARVATWVDVGGGFAPDKLLEGTRSMLASLAALREGKVTQEDVDLARTVALAGWRERLATEHGAGLYHAGRVARGRSLADDFPARMAKVTREDVIRVARIYLAERSLHLTIVADERWLDVSSLGMGGVVKLDL